MLYEQPQEDSGKEVVLWRPVLNWDENTPTYYHAARGLRTVHGTAHVQRAGLQKGAQHGIFHTPVTQAGERVGWRCALSARITWPDAEERLEPFILQYKASFGPEGQWTLPRRPRNAESDQSHGEAIRSC